MKSDCFEILPTTASSVLELNWLADTTTFILNEIGIDISAEIQEAQ